MSRLTVFFLMIAAPALSIGLGVLGYGTLQDNILGWFLLVVGVLYPAVVVINYVFLHRPFWKFMGSARGDREEKGDRTFWLALPGLLGVFFAPPLEWVYLPAVLPRAPWMQAAGLALVLAAAGLRFWARAGARLVQNGPYRYVRHPAYTSLVLAALGVALGYSSWIGLAAVLVLLLPALIYRIGIEEGLLIEQFGEEYHRFSARTKKLIPGLW
jgi:protein-S-isoprenylcysteine O-methyltransferase Ste14